MSQNRAVFLDRDGVLNDLEYDSQEERIASPLSAKQLRVFPYCGEAIRNIQKLGFKAILVSNQPGVAKLQLSFAEYERMNSLIRDDLAKQGCALDAEYYCLHHPDALVAKYKLDCDCRKPKPGLILRAARENSIELSRSYYVGDALVDVKAGRAAGCKTILLGHVTTFLTRMIDVEDAQPDFIAPSLRHGPELLRRQVEASEAKTRRRTKSS